LKKNSRRTLRVEEAELEAGKDAVLTHYVKGGVGLGQVLCLVESEGIDVFEVSDGGLVKGESLKEKGCNKNQMREQGGSGQGNLGHSEAAANRADDFVGIGHVIMVA
jgi:hypothetical protein